MDKIKISSCYCDIPLKKLVKLTRMRFIDRIETEEIMNRLTSQVDKEYLAVVALLDVNEKDLIHLVEAENPDQLQHFLACRNRTKEILEHYGLQVKEN